MALKSTTVLSQSLNALLFNVLAESITSGIFFIGKNIISNITGTSSKHLSSDHRDSYLIIRASEQHSSATINPVLHYTYADNSIDEAKTQ